MFDVKTMNGSRVSAKMAGTESTAKTMSRGLQAQQRDEQRRRRRRRPSSRTKKRWPRKPGVTGSQRRTQRG